jgi:hypothetical protein
MKYDTVRRKHFHMQNEVMNATTILVSAVEFALSDAKSALDPVTRKLLEDGLQRLKIAEDGA